MFLRIVSWLFLICATALMSVHAYAADSVIRVELRSEVKVSAANVGLSDVAEISSPDLDSMRQLMAVNLGRAPQLGQSLRLDRAMLEKWLMQSVGLRHKVIQWSGAEAVLITSLGQEVKASAIMQVAQEELARWLATRSDSAHIAPRYVPKDLVLPAGELELRVRPLREHEAVQSRMAMLVDVWVAKRFVRSVSVTFDVNAFRKALVAKHEIMGGQVIIADMFEPQEIDFAKLNEEKIPEDVGVVKHRAKMRITKGQVLTLHRVEPLPLAQKGDWARLVMRSGDFEVETQVEVLREGYLGQVVPVKSKSANGLLMATIVGEGLLEIKL